MTSKHTEGPWIAEADETNGMICIATKDCSHRLLAVLNEEDVEVSSEENAENARLMAESPEFFKALENIAGFHSELFDDKTAYQMREIAERAINFLSNA